MAISQLRDNRMFANTKGERRIGTETVWRFGNQVYTKKENFAEAVAWWLCVEVYDRRGEYHTTMSEVRKGRKRSAYDRTVARIMRMYP